MLCCVSVVVVWAAGVVMGAAPGPDRPDITMLYKGNTYTCVAGANTNGYGLAFMSADINKNVNINEFEYRDVYGAVVDSSSDCDFERRRGDTCWEYDWESNDLRLVKSGHYPIAPVTDERWNDFATYHTVYSAIPKYDVRLDINQKPFFTGISVRSTANAQILLCSTDAPKTKACYWIIIDGFTSTTDTTGIRKCVNGVPDTYATDREPDCKMLRHNVTTPRKLLDESKWTHFMLSREGGNRIRLWLWDLDTGATPLLDYTDADPLSLKYMYLRPYAVTADWKVHTYQFAYIRYKKGLIQLGPALNFALASPICVSLYVALCPTCKMEIQLEGDVGETVIQTIEVEGDSNGPFMKWKNVRFQGKISTSVLHKYQLWATLSTTDGTDVNTFWAIDDFRKCSNNEFRVISTSSKYDMLCQSLNYPGWTFNPNMQVQNNDPPRCSDGRYIGQHCNISCNAVIPYDGCGGQKICLSTQEMTNQAACTCAPGYKWDSYNGCTKQCRSGTYGYNCQNKCGKCKGIYTCYIDTGTCPNGCEDGHLPPYCQSTYPRLVFPLVVLKEFYTKVTLKFNDVTISGAEDDAQSVQLECKKTNTNEIWVNCSQQINPIPSRGQEVTVNGLDKETSYLIRAIVYTKTGYAYRNDDVPIVTVTTTCAVDLNTSITETSRNATISFENTSSDNCTLGRYLIELQQNGVQIRAPQYIWPNMILGNLTPFTDYKIILKHIRISSYRHEKDFKTKEDAPDQIENLKILETKETAVVLSWDEPKEKNGIIKKYIVTYELTQRIGCNNDIQISSIGNMIVLPPQISHVTVSGLQPYSTYNITVAAETILPGTPIGFLCNTTMIYDISDEELPDSISTTINVGSVTVHWAANCVKQRGPLYFKIVFMCMQEEWCHLTSDIVLDNVTSVNGGATAYGLTPFTHYWVELRAKRSQSGDLTTFNRITELYTPAGKPPVVRNFTDYSKNKSSIFLRWLDPYPPHGNLEKYTITYCYYTNSGCKTKEITANQLVPCDLWNDHFNCFTLTDLYKEFQYTINIKAKNKDYKLSSDETSLTVFTAEDKPSAPLNLTREWKNNEIMLSWNHPDITNGRLKKFIITLTQNGTELENQDGKPFYSYVYPIPQEMKNYPFQITKTYRYSSSYIVTVCGVNSYYGDNATLHIDTPPETPELAGDVIFVESTNTTVTIKIPGAKNNTKSKTSFLYVVVSKKGSSISKREVQEEHNVAQQIRDKSTCANSWIAIEKELNEGILTVVLGDNSVIESTNLNEPIHNKELDPSSDYCVDVVIINQYRDQRSFNVYNEIVTTIATTFPPSPALFALLLLLLLPVLGYIVYRYTFKKETRRASVMRMIPGLRGVRSEDQHDPDVIPLTEATNEPAQNKPKKPAMAPKPGPSSKPPETTAPAEVNTIGTTFFHSRIVLLENLEDYLKEALDNGELDEQHALFPRGQTKPWDYGMLKPNKFKNRYSNLIAYDKNRVKLEKINNDQYSDYINASYIHGYRQDKAYIATQGPKLATVNDFWRMIWQEKTIYIVMLANVVEAGKKKCEKYWPEIDSSREYGFVDVYFEKSEVYADYEYRTFELTCKGEKRKVTQLHFTSWPDHGVPLYPQSLVPFLKKMLTIPQTTAPVVVHCSAGVGRTGTIILCDICLRMAAREKAIDALRYLHEIREQRANMVDNIDQYKLVHMVLLECLLAPDTNIPCNADLSNSIQKLIEEGGLQIQLNHLQQSSWQDKALNFASTKQQNPANESKNRYNDIVPSENQVYISRYPVDDENSDYINAVPVDGFRFKEQFIVTQTPMPNTVKDFWRMVAEKSVKIIVSLNDIPSGDTTSCVFWPSENEEMKPVPNINLKHHKMQSFDYYDIYSIILDDKSSKEATMIQIVQFKNWKHESKLPKSEDNLVMLWEETENLSHGNYPMVVTCYDGATASGLFVAMSFVIEKIKLEQQCDPCLAVRVVRRNRKQFVMNKVQFEFLYRSAVIYLSMFETYSNFQPVVNKQNQ